MHSFINNISNINSCSELVHKDSKEHFIGALECAYLQGYQAEVNMIINIVNELDNDFFAACILFLEARSTFDKDSMDLIKNYVLRYAPAGVDFYEFVSSKQEIKKNKNKLKLQRQMNQKRNREKIYEKTIKTRRV